MLPFHTIQPQKRQQNDSEFVHYLSLGSYQTSFTHPSIFSFSKVMLTPKKHLPKLSHDDLKAKCESEGEKLHSLVVPLYGRFMVDQKEVGNAFEQVINSDNGTKAEEKMKNDELFVVKECNAVQDAEYVSNKQEKDKNAVFLYILYKTSTPTQTQTQPTTTSHQSRFTSPITQSHLIVLPLLPTPSSPQISLIQAHQLTSLTLLPNDLLYLQKGKITLLTKDNNHLKEIRNKGNNKGEQNYIQNMIIVSEEMVVEVEKGSLVFLVSVTKGNSE